MSWGSPVIDPGHTVVLHVWSKAPPGCSDHLRADGECWWAAFLICADHIPKRWCEG